MRDDCNGVYYFKFKKRKNNISISDIAVNARDEKSITKKIEPPLIRKFEQFTERNRKPRVIRAEPTTPNLQLPHTPICVQVLLLLCACIKKKCLYIAGTFVIIFIDMH